MDISQISLNGYDNNLFYRNMNRCSLHKRYSEMFGNRHVNKTAKEAMTGISAGDRYIDGPGGIDINGPPEKPPEPTNINGPPERPPVLTDINGPPERPPEPIVINGPPERPPEPIVIDGPPERPGYKMYRLSELDTIINLYLKNIKFAEPEIDIAS